MLQELILLNMRVQHYNCPITLYLNTITIFDELSKLLKSQMHKI